jgi:hypothetical protein
MMRRMSSPAFSSLVSIVAAALVASVGLVLSCAAPELLPVPVAAALWSLP